MYVDMFLKRFLYGILLILATLTVAWGFGFGLFVSQVVKKASPVMWETDAVVVLTGGGERVREGIRLLKSGAAKYLFVSGVGTGVTVDDLLRMNDAADDVGNPLLGERIILGRAAANTQGNAEETRAWVKAASVQSIRLVTANYHMPRSRIEFHLMMPGITLVPHPVQPPDFHLFNADGTVEESGVRLLVREYHKLLAVFLRQAGLWRAS